MPRKNTNYIVTGIMSPQRRNLVLAWPYQIGLFLKPFSRPTRKIKRLAIPCLPGQYALSCNLDVKIQTHYSLNDCVYFALVRFFEMWFLWSICKALVSATQLSGAHFGWARAALKSSGMSASESAPKIYWARAQISAHFCAQNLAIFKKIDV